MVRHPARAIGLALWVLFAGCSYPVEDFTSGDAAPFADAPSSDTRAAETSVAPDTALAADTTPPVDSSPAKDTAVDDAACGASLTRCGPDCVNLKTDPAHCGDCATRCDVPGGEKCRGGSCN